MSSRDAAVRIEADDTDKAEIAASTEEQAAPATPPPSAPPAFVPKPVPIRLLYALTSVTAAIMQGLGTSLISANLAQIAGPLEATQNEASWLVAAYLFPNVSLGLFLFKVRTQYGIRNFCELAIIPFVIVSLAHLWVNDLTLSIALRFFAGAAAAPISSMAFLYMLEIFPPEKKLNVGLCLALIGLSLSAPIAGLVSPSLLDANDLQGLYMLELGLALVVFGLIYILPLTSPPRAKVISSMDYVSYGLLAVSMGCLAVFFTMGRLYWWLEADWLGWVLAGGIATGSILAMLELNRRNHLIDIRWISSWEIVHFAGVLLVFRMLLTEQQTGAINFFRQLGMFNEQMTGIYWAILIASIVSGLFCAMIMKPGREARHPSSGPDIDRRRHADGQLFDGAHPARADVCQPVADRLRQRALPAARHGRRFCRGAEEGPHLHHQLHRCVSLHPEGRRLHRQCAVRHLRDVAGAVSFGDPDCPAAADRSAGGQPHQPVCRGLYQVEPGRPAAHHSGHQPVRHAGAAAGLCSGL
ncbi:MFS transporter (plasmid) [Aliirhizobium terrae]|nr:MFS transporter [Rhizobium sp. CC-CFT758]WJH38122.1 MFS transporter [Rhizobium sp. CC-CFT758]